MVPEIVDVWNAALGDEFPMREALFRQNTLLDPHFDPEGCRLACGPDGRVLGACVAKVAREPLGSDGLLEDRGWVSALVVHPAAQRRGIATALLHHAEAFLRSRGRRRVLLGGDPGHFFPGIPIALAASGASADKRTPAPDGSAGGGRAALAFFGKRGYALRGDAYDLRRPLGGYRTPPGVEAALAATAGTEVRPLRPGEEPALLAFPDATSPGRWRYTVGRILVRGGAIGDVMGIVENGAVLGFAHVFPQDPPWISPSVAWTWRERQPVGGLGPMGVAPRMRGRGLGLALVDRAAVHLARRGVAAMVIDWTVLLDFYGRLGFAPWRRYRHGEKRLAGGR